MFKTIVFMLAISIPAVASAETECTAKVIRIWAGNGGNVMITLANGGNAVITPNDPNREAALAIALTAQTTDRTVTVRYNASNLACNTTVNDFAGIFLNSNP